MVANNNIEQLVLSHFSSRYDQAQIDEKIKEQNKTIKVVVANDTTRLATKFENPLAW